MRLVMPTCVAETPEQLEALVQEEVDYLIQLRQELSGYVPSKHWAEAWGGPLWISVYLSVVSYIV